MLPHQAIECVQREDKSVLDQNTPWICASCFSCSTRCPRGVDVATVMEALREIKLRKRSYRKVNLHDIKNKKDLPQIAITAAAQKFTW